MYSSGRSRYSAPYRCAPAVVVSLLHRIMPRRLVGIINWKPICPSPFTLSLNGKDQSLKRQRQFFYGHGFGRFERIRLWYLGLWIHHIHIDVVTHEVDGPNQGT